MLFNKLNRIIILAIILPLIIILCLAVFLMASYYPGVIGSPSQEYQIEEKYQFEPWDFLLDDIYINFDEGGLMAQVLQEERIKGAFFKGDATYHSPTFDLPTEAEGFLVLVDGDTIISQKDDVIFSGVESSQKENINNIFDNKPGIPTYEGAGVPLSFPPQEDSFYLYFMDEDHEKLSPVIHNTKSELPWLTGLFYSLIFIIIILVIQLLSLGFKPLEYRSYYPNLSSSEFLAFVLVVLMVFAAHHLQKSLELPDYFTAAGYGLVLIVVFLLSRHQMFVATHMGVNKNTCKNGYFLAGIVSVIFLFLPFEVFSGIKAVSLGEAFQHFVWIFLSAGLLHEMVWRGYIQVSLSRLAGRHLGLIITVLLSGLFHYFIVFLNSPEALAFPFAYIDIAVLVPGTALVLGYLFIRTENIFSCALLHSIIVFLPQYLNY